MTDEKTKMEELEDETTMRAVLIREAEMIVGHRAMPKTIAAALVKAQALTERVGKDGNNSFHKYRYTSAEAVMEAARDPMAAAGIAIVQMGWTMSDPRIVPTLEWVPADPAKTGKGERFIPTESKDILPGAVTIRYLLTHDSGDTWEMPPVIVPVIPEAGRPWDKALFTALTFAQAYVLRGLLKMPRSGDPDETEAPDDGDQRNDNDTNSRGTKTRGPSAEDRAEAKRLAVVAELEAAIAEIVNIPGWVKETGPKAVRIVGMEVVQNALRKRATQLEFGEPELMAEFAKLVAASKR